MPVHPRPTIVAERHLTPQEMSAVATRWTISFDVPEHVGLPHGAHLFRVYSGLDVAVKRSGPSALRVTATGTAAELRRLIEWTDDLYRSRDVNIAGAFAGHPVMGAQPGTPGRQIA